VAAKLLTAFRLVSPRWADTAFSGEGARKFGGRWNSPGRPVVYLSESRALAALELLVHLTTPESRLKQFVRFEVVLPSDMIEVLPLSTLPAGWRASPPTRASSGFGDRWLEEDRSLILRVPSVLVPEEGNLLLNVTHPSFPSLEISEPHAFSLDPRFAPPPSTL
jgi:RES domain-containing protein